MFEAWFTLADGSVKHCLCDDLLSAGVTRPYPEMLNSWASRWGYRVEQIAADTPDNITWRRS